MMNMLFTIFTILIFWKLLKLAFRLSWGIIKLILAFVFFPVILAGLVIAGLMSVAFSVLIIVGIATFIGGLIAI